MSNRIRKLGPVNHIRKFIGTYIGSYALSYDIPRIKFPCEITLKFPMFMSYSKTHVKIFMQLHPCISYAIYFCYIFPVIHFRISQIEFNFDSSTRVLHGFFIGNEHRKF